MCWPSVDGGEVQVQERIARYPGEPRRKRLSFVSDRDSIVRDRDEWTIARPVSRRNNADTVVLPRSWVDQHVQLQDPRQRQQHRQLMDPPRQVQQYRQQQLPPPPYLDIPRQTQQYGQHPPPPPPPPPPPGFQHHNFHNVRPQSRIDYPGPRMISPNGSNGYNANGGNAGRINQPRYIEQAPRAQMPPNVRWGSGKGPNRSQSRRPGGSSLDSDDFSIVGQRRFGGGGRSVATIDSEDSWEHGAPTRRIPRGGW
ncbi:hypothetical protein MMC09_004598 [Bachmanniomyces sp. S44760]|nr:hypothetical protein [Bachmanniomyces sp. S44760]